MPKQGTVAKVVTLPPCDFCKMIDIVRKAEYDFKTQSGQWGYGCKTHYEQYRLYQGLGTGMGQKLELIGAGE